MIHQEIRCSRNLHQRLPDIFQSYCHQLFSCMCFHTAIVRWSFPEATPAPLPSTSLTLAPRFQPQPPLSRQQRLQPPKTSGAKHLSVRGHTEMSLLNVRRKRKIQSVTHMMRVYLGQPQQRLGVQTNSWFNTCLPLLCAVFPSRVT